MTVREESGLIMKRPSPDILTDLFEVPQTTGHKHVSPCAKYTDFKICPQPQSYKCIG